MLDNEVIYELPKIAVDVAEVARRRFLEGVEIGKIEWIEQAKELIL